MAENNRKGYRVRTGIGDDSPSSINISLENTYDTIDVLSLEIKQTNFYKMPSSEYGAIVGRVIANGGFGIPNAKVSVFVPYSGNAFVEDNGVIYHYASTMSKDDNGVRYNLLPRKVDNVCHQDVGTMWEKEYLLDNNDYIQVFDKYYKYTAVTNNAGDYFIYGVPVGSQTVHVDIDLSDIGPLSQRPRDFMYKGYNAELFDSPNKFKKSTNLNSLSQIFSQDKVVMVSPFWGDTTMDASNGVLTRCDINIDYKFEPTCVFIGSIISDTGSKGISQKCVPDDEMGKMSDIITGEGKIEMIRRTFDGKVEQFSIKGNNLIDGDGVWCYQIPMNLDYVMTDEFGNTVPTDDPNKGIATRTRVRFRISMNETGTEETANKRARFLVPNNPKLNDDYPDFKKTHIADYEFGTNTKDESYRDMFWNKVYTVKSYIPRLQKAKSLRRRVHTGIKNVNHPGANNPMPFNNLFMRLTFLYIFICELMSVFCITIRFINDVMGYIGWAMYYIGKGFHNIRMGLRDSIIGNWMHHWCFLEVLAQYCLHVAQQVTIKLENFCDDGNFDNPTYVPIMRTHPWITIMTNPEYKIRLGEGCDDVHYIFPEPGYGRIDSNLSRLFNCIENQLAQDQECTSFNFNNDWVNGVLYAPLWYRKVRIKKKILFFIKLPDRDRWCSASNPPTKSISLCNTCAPKRMLSPNKDSIRPLTYSSEKNSDDNCNGYRCHKKAVSFISLERGLIVQKETMLGENVYYYKSVEYDKTNLFSQEVPNTMGDIKMLFATDIVLLGSLNDCDSEGIPQFFNRLEGTTYNMPSDLITMDYDSDESKIKYQQKAVGDESVQEELGIGDEGLSSLPDDIDETSAIDPNSVHTDRTGADWGNFGVDQISKFYNDVDRRTENDYVLTSTLGDNDFGGLFYGLTCYLTFTKPKSCVNLSRICEFGVSLDQTTEMPVYDGSTPSSESEIKYELLAPDGFVSYDELYDNDGRAMFATMNGNNLKTKVNPENGFPVYDFMYLYPENFDGSLSYIMMNTDGFPDAQSKNHNLEYSSDAYLRFRYGRNRTDRTIQFYNTKVRNGLYSGDDGNNGRFPKYENSFYFYFGLVPGSTAIDKFRTLYYSECNSDDSEHMVSAIQFEGNTWCSEVGNDGTFSSVGADGWVSVDATYVDAPYTVKFENINGDTSYNSYSDENNPFTEPKIYFASIGKTDLENDGFSWKELYTTPEPTSQSDVQYLMNSRYKVTITDANGEEFSQVIDYTKPYISATIGMSPFRIKNKDLTALGQQYVKVTNNDLKMSIAQQGGRLMAAFPGELNSDETMNDRTVIGGFIKVTGISQESDSDIDFRVEIEPLFNVSGRVAKIVSGDEQAAQQYEATRSSHSITSYSGSLMDFYSNGRVVTNPDFTLMNEENGSFPPYCPYDRDLPPGGNFNLRFGVPVGGERYRVTVTMLCTKDNKSYHKSRNVITSVVTVPEPIEFKMFINGTDYSLIKNFNSGWAIDNEYPAPTNLDKFLGTLRGNSDFSRVSGWTELGNISGLSLLGLIPEGHGNEQQYEYQSYIQHTDEVLSGLDQSGDEFNWTGEYLFNADEAITDIETFESVPSTMQGGRLIRVNNGNGVYVYYRWDNEDAEYQPYKDNNNNFITTISLKQYYHYGSETVKNNVITILNRYIAKRISASENAKKSFYMRNGGFSTLTINYATYETPVKTGMYHVIDGEDETVNLPQLLDTYYNANSDYGIYEPTIKGSILSEQYAYVPANAYPEEIGIASFNLLGHDANAGNNEDDRIWKKPWLVAGKNALGEYLPSQAGDLETDDGIANYFAVHLIDKNIKFVYNAWPCMENWAYYGNTSNDETIMAGNNPLKPNVFTLPGLFAGYVLDGAPDSYEDIEVSQNEHILETKFKSQNLSEQDVYIATLSISTTDASVDEDRIPVVRLIFNNEIDDCYYDNYSVHDRIWSDGTSVDNGTLIYNKIGKGQHHLLLRNSEEILSISDKYSSKTLSFAQEVYPTDIQNYENEENDADVYVTTIVFPEDFYYTYYKNQPNPVYTKYALDTTSAFVFGQHQNMLFFNGYFDFGERNNFYVSKSNCDNCTTLYVVQISKDKQVRTISRTFDLTPIEYVFYIDTGVNTENSQNNNTSSFYLCLNVGKDNSFYYLKYYDFTIEFIVDGNVWYTKTVSDGYVRLDSSWHVPTNSNGIYYCKIDCTDFYNMLVEMLQTNPESFTGEEVGFYITDITGIKRLMIPIVGSENPTYNNFTHQFRKNGN